MVLQGLGNEKGMILWSTPNGQLYHLTNSSFLFDLQEAKLVECRPTGFGTFAVVHRLKTDYLTITKKGGKVASSVDSRLCIQCRPGAFKFGTNFTLQVRRIQYIWFKKYYNDFEFPLIPNQWWQITGLLTWISSFMKVYFHKYMCKTL